MAETKRELAARAVFPLQAAFLELVTFRRAAQRNVLRKLAKTKAMDSLYIL